MIPKIIHQIWLDRHYDNNIYPPGKYLKLGYSQKYQDLNPDYQYLFWNMIRVQELLRDERYKKYQTFFNNLNHHIEKCDFSRYLILHKYGGFYFDLDIEPYQAFPNEVLKRDLFLIYESTPTNDGLPAITNVYMASSKNHPMWLEFMDYIMANYQRGGLSNVYGNTGTKALTQFVRKFHPELETKMNLKDSCRYMSKYVSGTDYETIEHCKNEIADNKVSDINWLDGSLWGNAFSYKENKNGQVIIEEFNIGYIVGITILIFIIIGFIITIAILSSKISKYNFEL